LDRLILHQLIIFNMERSIKKKKDDYVIVHAGFAIQVIDKEEALVTQGYWKEWLDEEGNQ